MNQKELNELGDLINERRELELKFKVDVAKLDERIAAKVGKLQPEPVKPETGTTYHRKERSDKGVTRKGITPEPASQPGPSGEPVTIAPDYMQPEPAG